MKGAHIMATTLAALAAEADRNREPIQVQPFGDYRGRGLVHVLGFVPGGAIELDVGRAVESVSAHDTTPVERR